jgi:hypothetical protein
LREAAHRSLRPAASASTALARTSHHRYCECSVFERRPLRTERAAGTSSFSAATSSGLCTSAETLCFTFLISTHRIDRQLEIARILLNGFERDFADPDEISWPERARSPQSQIRQCDRNGRPDCSDRALQRVVTRDIRHADPEHANQGCKEKQPKPAHQHVLSQIFPISMSALRSTCTSRTR